MTDTAAPKLTITTDMIKRTAKQWSDMAGETIHCEKIGGAVFGFGSELATLRLFRKFNLFEGHNQVAGAQGYSDNLKTFYFRIETKY